MTPKPIPEKLFKRQFTKKDAKNPTARRGKDVYRTFNVTVELGKHIREENNKHPNDQDMHYFWFDDYLTDGERNKRSKNIIEDVLRAQLGSSYGSMTYSQCQHHIAQTMECAIEILAKHAQLRPYTQTDRNIALRKLVMQKMETKHRTHREKMKKEAQTASAAASRVVGNPPAEEKNDGRKDVEHGKSPTFKNSTTANAESTIQGELQTRSDSEGGGHRMAESLASPDAGEDSDNQPAYMVDIPVNTAKDTASLRAIYTSKGVSASLPSRSGVEVIGEREVLTAIPNELVEIEKQMKALRKAKRRIEQKEYSSKPQTSRPAGPSGNRKMSSSKRRKTLGPRRKN